MLRHYQYPVRTIMYRLYAPRRAAGYGEPPTADGRPMVATLPNDVFFAFRSRQAVARPAGRWSDLPFRLLCRRFGAAVCCTEMISARGSSTRAPDGGTCSPPARRTGLSSSSCSAARHLSWSAARAAQGQGFRLVRLQYGLLRPKVARTGSGAAMCKDIDNALSVAEAHDPGCRARTRRLQAAPRLG